MSILNISFHMLNIQKGCPLLRTLDLLNLSKTRCNNIYNVVLKVMLLHFSLCFFYWIFSHSRNHIFIFCVIGCVEHCVRKSARKNNTQTQTHTGNGKKFCLCYQNYPLNWIPFSWENGIQFLLLLFFPSYNHYIG